MNWSLIIQIVGIVFTAGVVWGVINSKTKSFEMTLEEFKVSIGKFGERMGSAETNIALQKQKCDLTHKKKR